MRRRGAAAVVAEPPTARQPRSRQYYLSPQEGDNLIDARATLGLVVGIAPSSRETRARRREIMHVGRNSSSAGSRGELQARARARVCKNDQTWRVFMEITNEGGIAISLGAMCDSFPNYSVYKFSGNLFAHPLPPFPFPNNEETSISLLVTTGY